MRKKVYMLLLTIFLAGFSLAGDPWPEADRYARPGCIWWWLGSAVDAENLRWNLDLMHQAGMGGGTIVAIYGAKDAKDRYIPLASDQWFEMVSTAVQEANKRDMYMDLTPGSGWPFGGPDLPEKYQAQDFKYSKDNGLSVRSGVMGVKRAAPGGKGKVLNPFYPDAMDYYLSRFDKGLSDMPVKPRALYHDSFEYRGNFSEAVFQAFHDLCGYDLKEKMDRLVSKDKDAEILRVKADYSRTISRLHNDYIDRLVNWAHARDMEVRNQAHGGPCNILDTYAAADIPETETFGAASYITMPDYLFEPEHSSSKSSYPMPMLFRFASSAAHVAGKQNVGAESCTWLRNHFHTALWHIKPVIDTLFITGTNQVYFHGMAYSPKDDAWPGWLFYASIEYNPRNAFWRDVRAMNDYITRCQSVLQSGRPDSDFLLYWPIEDEWHRGIIKPSFSAHHREWYENRSFGKIFKMLNDSGYALDFISDKQVQKLTESRGRIKSPGAEYRTIIIPATQYMPIATMRKVLELAAEGADVLFEALPQDVPGLKDFENRRLTLQKLNDSLQFKSYADYLKAAHGKGHVYLTTDMNKAAGLLGLKPETIVERGVSFIRRKDDRGGYYFFSNVHDKTVDGWIQMGRDFKSALIMDPLTAETGVARIKRQGGNTLLYLQLAPGESLIVKTDTRRNFRGAKWQYITLQPDQRIAIDAKWDVEFIQGGPILPAPMKMELLKSWTTHTDENAQSFAGTAKYSTTFEMPSEKADDWILDLGLIRDSARVTVNGKPVGTVWSLPFQIRIGQYLRPGENTLEIEVTNLSANRIRDLDKRKVNWKKFREINFVNHNYKKYDASNWPLRESGLLGTDGKIHLIGCKAIKFD